MGLRHEDFLRLFDEWAPTYDQTVSDPTADGFENYEQVLACTVAAVGAPPGTTVVDVGAGTGNLTRALGLAGYRPVAVEPSRGMREVLALKLPGVPVLDGHFLAIPLPGASAGAVVSTYAFHHLTDADKARGARELLRVLQPGGRVVIGDVAFRDAAARARFRADLLARGRQDLVDEMDSEYYTTVAVLTGIFRAQGCTVTAQQLDAWVWLITARAPGPAGRV